MVLHYGHFPVGFCWILLLALPPAGLGEEKGSSDSTPQLHPWRYDKPIEIHYKNIDFLTDEQKGKEEVKTPKFPKLSPLPDLPLQLLPQIDLERQNDPMDEREKPERKKNWILPPAQDLDEDHYLESLLAELYEQEDERYRENQKEAETMVERLFSRGEPEEEEQPSMRMKEALSEDLGYRSEPSSTDSRDPYEINNDPLMLLEDPYGDAFSSPGEKERLENRDGDDMDLTSFQPMDLASMFVDEDVEEEADQDSSSGFRSGEPADAGNEPVDSFRLEGLGADEGNETRGGDGTAGLASVGEAADSEDTYRLSRVQSALASIGIQQTGETPEGGSDSAGQTASTGTGTGGWKTTFPSLVYALEDAATTDSQGPNYMVKSISKIPHNGAEYPAQKQTAFDVEPWKAAPFRPIEVEPISVLGTPTDVGTPLNMRNGSYGANANEIGGDPDFGGVSDLGGNPNSGGFAPSPIGGTFTDRGFGIPSAGLAPVAAFGGRESFRAGKIGLSGGGLAPSSFSDRPVHDRRTQGFDARTLEPLMNH